MTFKMEHSDEWFNSKLCNKEYWDDHYDRELVNFNDMRDEGDIWFGCSSEERIINQILQLPKSSRIIDFGTGNGSLLRKLYSHGFMDLCGIDYSEKAIDLAKTITAFELGSHHIDFMVADVTSDDSWDYLGLGSRFNIILDKGTFDAITLCDDRNSKIKNYKNALKRVIIPNNGMNVKAPRYFIIVSCNYTRDELVSIFTNDADLELVREIPQASSFTFGGKLGHTTTGCVFVFRN